MVEQRAAADGRHDAGQHHARRASTLSPDGSIGAIIEQSAETQLIGGGEPCCSMTGRRSVCQSQDGAGQVAPTHTKVEGEPVGCDLHIRPSTGQPPPPNCRPTDERLDGRQQKQPKRVGSQLMVTLVEHHGGQLVVAEALGEPFVAEDLRTSKPGDHCPIGQRAPSHGDVPIPALMARFVE